MLNTKPYKNYLDKIVQKGFLGVQEIIADGSQENFYLDFKNISTLENSKISEEDRKNLAKAISGFSNTSGGLLVWGVKDNRNSTFSENSITYSDYFVGILNDTVSSLTLPVVSEVVSFSVKNKAGQGFVITEIPKYFFSPVQVTPYLKGKVSDLSGRYYIRSGSDFVTANHDIISSLYNRELRSELVYVWTTDTGSYSEDEKKVTLEIGFCIRNKGISIVEDIWVNYSASNLNSSLNDTPQSSNFNGWDFHGLFLNLISKDNFKLAPQQTVKPFSIKITIPKVGINDNSYFYTSFGSNSTTPKEIAFTITQDKMDKFLLIPKGERNTISFIKTFFPPGYEN